MIFIIIFFLEMDKKLFTPGPLLTSKTVKEAALRDLGSRDLEFIEAVESIRSELLKVAGEFIKVVNQKVHPDFNW